MEINAAAWLGLENSDLSLPTVVELGFMPAACGHFFALTPVLDQNDGRRTATSQQNAWKYQWEENRRTQRQDANQLKQQLVTKSVESIPGAWCRLNRTGVPLAQPLQ